jgi:hypothetical protein
MPLSERDQTCTHCAVPFRTDRPEDPDKYCDLCPMRYLSKEGKVAYYKGKEDQGERN